MTGRPIRFLAMTVGGWTATRVAMLWPTIDSVPDLIRTVIPPVAAATAFYAGAPTPVAMPRSPAPVRPPAIAPSAMQPIPAPQSEPIDGNPATAAPVILHPPSLLPSPAPGRWSASLWAVARTGLIETRPGNQLGGSQAGVRLSYLLDRARRLSATARFSTSIAQGGREAAIGLDWQPTAAPVHLIVERRIAIDGGRGGPAALIVGGLSPHPLALGLSAEAYAQTGAVLRDRVEPFADGAIRITRPIFAARTLQFDLGIGTWAGAQRGAARVDIGPTIGVAIPVANRRIRLSLDWRQRIAGNARPGSGPALTLGTDF